VQRSIRVPPPDARANSDGLRPRAARLVPEPPRDIRDELSIRPSVDQYDGAALARLTGRLNGPDAVRSQAGEVHGLDLPALPVIGSTRVAEATHAPMAARHGLGTAAARYRPAPASGLSVEQSRHLASGTPFSGQENYC
jgi:hypothetical protein